MSKSITNSNKIVRPRCMRNLNYSEGVGLIFSLCLNPATAGCRGHKKSNILCNLQYLGEELAITARKSKNLAAVC